MKKNILLVLNPTAGSIDVDSVLSKTKSWSQKLGCNLTTYKTTGENDEDKIEQLLKKVTYERVIAAGGDGTLKMVASVLIETPIILGILACGSANGLATSLAVPKDLNEQLEIAFQSHPKTIDTIVVNDTLCIHIADVGINAELIYNYEKSKSSGMLGYAIQAIPTLFKSQGPYEFKISLKENVINKKGILLAFTNAKKYGTGAMINPDGKINDGHFEVIIFNKLSIKDILKTFIRRLSIPKTSVEIYTAKSVSVTCKEPVPLQVDGEFIGKFKKFSAHIKPESLKIAMHPF
ncbi:diacylglycerol kinase family protein [Lacinutrix sp. Hel_I_90]|uniref:diacylglycerol/lipid kinase family protein n=1 Tax=Lacinutrix sp. Hel_I_90 TaxID=1249999 RepID=UPI000ABA0E0A|nr:diacylglycerol kinase family protein [Lacinutrix sp. Hel_I_90]